MEITYDTGAKVILQGPVTYEIEAENGGFLRVGKLTGKVETQSARGFSVRTPTAKVTDLGTEFGVEILKDGNCQVHVLAGSVDTVALENGRPKGQSCRLGAGQAVQVISNRSSNVAGSAIVALKKAEPTTFVRKLPRPPKLVDLLDIVAGGTGAGHARERGIDPSTGMEDAMYVASYRNGGGKYHRASWNRLIDGVFIPRVSVGTPVVLDSAGHTYKDFPTTPSYAWGSIWARAATLPNNELARQQTYGCYAMGRGDQFMPAGRGVLFCQPSVGITFNLKAIRHAHADAQPIRFRAVAGLADCRKFPTLDPKQRELWGHKPNNVVSFWVFVDGRVAVARRDIQPEDGAIPLNVDLGPSDVFLTLATINDRGVAWFVFGDPVLEASVPESAPAESK
jgi:hypothetical protein